MSDQGDAERRKPSVRGVNHWTIKAENAEALGRGILDAVEAGALTGIRVTPYDDAEGLPQVRIRVLWAGASERIVGPVEVNDSVICPPFC